MDRSHPLARAREAVAQALNAGNSPGGLPAALLLERGTLKLYFYEPRGEDQQTPHGQDEVYVVISGSGTFAVGATEEALERMPFGPGDALFAPAGAVHRFEDFTDDFGTWVIMYGPSGGEQPAAP
ncbi:MAG: cupin domain-containing protein [Methyloligellaceae bacterium]